MIMNISMACFFGPTPADAALLDGRSGSRGSVAGSLVTQAIRFTTRTGLLAMRGLADESWAVRRSARMSCGTRWERQR